MGKKTLDLGRPRLFTSSNIRKIMTDSDMRERKPIDVEAGTTSSYRYDPLGTGLKSTQQSNIDFSKFENHTFFNSAIVNTNIAFDKIINFYPFDGTKKEKESFEDRLTGFEKHILDTWPKSKGYLSFGPPASGSYISVEDMKGITNPSLSREDTAQAALDPGQKSVSIEFHILLPDNSQKINNQIICQKIDSTKKFGYSVATHEAASSQSSSVIFSVCSGSSTITQKMPISRGRFHHVALVFNRDKSLDRLLLYRNTKLIVTSTTRSDIGSFGAGFKAANLLIGSGSSFTTSSYGSAERFVPGTTFTGSLDEFRIHHKSLTLADIKENYVRDIEQNEDLAVYFKFNEPTGTLGSSTSTVLDYSGNSLHASVSNFHHDMRSTGSVDNPMVGEDKHNCPVLFPGYSDVITKNKQLLVTASAYDNINPNLITRLVPPHYFDEGMIYQGLANVDGSITSSYGGSGRPGSGDLGTYQILSAFLYTWAKHFDELKIQIDAFANILTADYRDPDTVPDQFLPFLMKYYGFDVPNMFQKSSTSQYVEGRDLKTFAGLSSESLAKVQSKIWRQVLSNLSEIMKSKGTLNSVKSILRSVGIDPDSSLRIREFGGPTRRSLSGSRATRKAIKGMINFSGSLKTAPGTLTTQGVSLNKPFLISPFLSGSRVEPGIPNVKGTFGKKNKIVTGTNVPADGFYTSGSWTYEAMYRFPQRLTGSMILTQSLVRLGVTGTSAPSNKNGIVLNLVLVSGSEVTGSRLTLHARPGRDVSTSASKFFELTLTGTEMMNGDLWWVSFGRTRNDLISTPNSSSYFLRAACPNLGEINTNKLYMTSSFFQESTNKNNIVFSNKSVHNLSGAFILIGSQSLDLTSNYFLHRDVTGDTRKSNEIHATDFMGQVSNVRFWSKALAEDEWQEHVRNYKSLGVRNPAVNFNFTTKISGSFEKLRMDVSADQTITGSNASRQITFTDYSQNYNHLTGTGFEVSASIIKPVDLYYTHLTTKIDELVASNKIRVRGFSNFSKAKNADVEVAPVYALNKSEEPLDDPRFSVDFSVVDALDEDIVSIFGTLEFLDNAIGDPELIFSNDYPKLDHLRYVYFDKLTGVINHQRFFEFFKWFDTTIGSFIENVLPRKTSFLGTNFVIESHMLERPKMEYFFNKQYLNESDRRGLKGTITLTQYTGDVKKF